MDQSMHYLVTYGPYLGLLIAAIFEGPAAAFVAGTLVATGVFNPFIAFGILAFKDLVLDTAFYWIGRSAQLPYFAERISKWRTETKLGTHVLAPLERQWHQHPVLMMWVTKLAYGLSMYLLITAGMAGLPFKKFYLYTLPVTIFQFGGLMVLGYVLGISMWNSTSWVFVITQLAIAAGAVFFATKALSGHIRHKFAESEERGEQP